MNSRRRRSKIAASRFRQQVLRGCASDRARSDFAAAIKLGRIGTLVLRGAVLGQFVAGGRLSSDLPEWAACGGDRKQADQAGIDGVSQYRRSHGWCRGSAPAKRWLTGAIADPAIRPSHCRAPMTWICWATRSNPPGCPPPAANSRSPSETRNQRNAWCFMAFGPSPVSVCSWSGLCIALVVLTGNAHIGTDR